MFNFDFIKLISNRRLLVIVGGAFVIVIVSIIGFLGYRLLSCQQNITQLSQELSSGTAAAIYIPTTTKLSVSTPAFLENNLGSQNLSSIARSCAIILWGRS